MKFIEAILVGKYFDVLKKMDTIQLGDVVIMLGSSVDHDGISKWIGVSRFDQTHDEYLPAVMSGTRISIYWS